MSYQVIARKWRPKTFEDLVGQSHIRQTLHNALKGDRLHHSLLLTGPRGTGKTSTARIIAKSLRCPKAIDFVPCNQCADCEDISLGRSLDVIEIDGASNNGVDSVRELRDTVAFMPSSGKYKLYIIDEVHMLSTSAFNALLKTLEEPPGHVVFIMATTEAHKIPNTILSRCQRFDFRRISTKAISENLLMICQAEGIQADPLALWSIARQGDGSMRDSQSLLDQLITFSGKEISVEKVTEALGLTDRRLILESLKALVLRDSQMMVEIAKKNFSAGYDPRNFVQDLLLEIRHALFIKLNPEAAQDLVDLPESEITELKELCAELSEEDMHLLFDMALKGASDLMRAQDQKIVLEMLLLRMAAAPRIENLLGRTGSSASTKNPASQNAQSKTGAVSRSYSSSSASKNTSEPSRGTGARESSAQSRNFASENSSVTSAKDTSISSSANSAGRSSARDTQGSDYSSALGAQDHDSNRLSVTSANSQQNYGADDRSASNRASAQDEEVPLSIDPSQNLNEQWHALVNRIKKINPVMAASLENTLLTGVAGKNLKLSVGSKKKFIFDKIVEADFKRKALNYISTFWGAGFDYAVELGEESEGSVTPRAFAQSKEEERQSEVRKAVENHPLVKATQSVFKTEIKSIKEMKS